MRIKLVSFALNCMCWILSIPKRFDSLAHDVGVTRHMPGLIITLAIHTLSCPIDIFILHVIGVANGHGWNATTAISHKFKLIK